jgi:hypothetical protein
MSTSSTGVMFKLAYHPSGLRKTYFNSNFDVAEHLNVN